MRLKHIALLSLLSSSSAFAAGTVDERPQVGDPVNGKKLYDKECGACHGDGGSGGRSGVALRDSGRMNLLRDDQLYAILKTGAGVKKEPNHKFEGKLSYLELWDVRRTRTRCTSRSAEFFPDATTTWPGHDIDENGLKRIEKAIGKRPEDKRASVFTFFKKAGMEPVMEYVPQDPIKLDHLKKKEKIDTSSSSRSRRGLRRRGRRGDGPRGKIRRVLVHRSIPNAELLNKSLSRFEGLGKKGQRSSQARRRQEHGQDRLGSLPGVPAGHGERDHVRS
jgi:hypothetical protein